MKKRKFLLVLFGFVLGLLVASSVGYAATTILASNVSYSNSSSGLSSTNVQGAIDELAEKSSSDSNFVSAYTYNSSSCVTGTESTCVRTRCYENKSAVSCPAGTIINYKVNSSTTKTFTVLYDKANYLIMQGRDSIANTPWNNTGTASSGPIQALSVLESATSGWSNVNSQSYVMGTTIFKTNKYTGCDTMTFDCTSNIYTLSSRTAKARMITMQELIDLGCTSSSTCPGWVTPVEDFWTMSASLGYSSAIDVYRSRLSSNSVNSSIDVVPVVEVSK